MALTLQERANLTKGLPSAVIASTAVTPIEKIDAQLKKIAGEFLQGELLRSNIPNIDSFNPSNTQMVDWCNRVLDGIGMTNRMVPSVIGYAAWDTEGTDPSDASIRNTCLNCVAAFAAKI